MTDPDCMGRCAEYLCDLSTVHSWYCGPDREFEDETTLIQHQVGFFLAPALCSVQDGTYPPNSIYTRAGKNCHLHPMLFTLNVHVLDMYFGFPGFQTFTIDCDVCV
jgi:hypothetical protein